MPLSSRVRRQLRVITTIMEKTILCDFCPKAATQTNGDSAFCDTCWADALQQQEAQWENGKN